MQEFIQAFGPSGAVVAGLVFGLKWLAADARRREEAQRQDFQRQHSEHRADIKGMMDTHERVCSGFSRSIDNLAAKLSERCPLQPRPSPPNQIDQSPLIK